MLRQFTVGVEVFVAERALGVRVDDGTVPEFVVLFQVFMRDLFTHEYRSVFYANITLVFQVYFFDMLLDLCNVDKLFFLITIVNRTPLRNQTISLIKTLFIPKPNSFIQP